MRRSAESVSVYDELERDDKRPRISGVLNNCAIGVVLPVILDNILILGQQGYLAESESINNEYEHLRQCFARYYEVDPATLSWRHLHDLLKKESFYTVQLIMGPVMREYLADQALYSGQYDDGLKMKQIVAEGSAEPHAIGRYPGITPEEAAQLLYQPLGIKANFYKARSGNIDLYDKHEVRNSGELHDAPEIDVYYKGDHYELRKHAQLHAASQFDMNTLPVHVTAAHENITSGDGRRVQLGLEQLKAYTCASLKAVIDETHAPIAPRTKKSRIMEKTKSYKDALFDVYETSNSFFSQIPEHKKIKINELDKAEAEAGESDEDFAKRLQEAEFRAAGFKK